MFDSERISPVLNLILAENVTSLSLQSRGAKQYPKEIQGQHVTKVTIRNPESLLFCIMIKEELISHWDRIYSGKNADQFSWYEKIPAEIPEIIKRLELPDKPSLIDVGGGESRLADILIKDGYGDITILDISGEALRISQSRLTEHSGSVEWIESDILRFQPTRQYDIWHDRACLHFLQQESQRDIYFEIMTNAIRPGGYAILSGFAKDGPKKCSGLDVWQLDENELEINLSKNFIKISCAAYEHLTPSGAGQNFLTCVFRKKPH